MVIAMRWELVANESPTLDRLPVLPTNETVTPDPHLEPSNIRTVVAAVKFDHTAAEGTTATAARPPGHRSLRRLVLRLAGRKLASLGLRDEAVQQDRPLAEPRAA